MGKTLDDQTPSRHNDPGAERRLAPARVERRKISVAPPQPSQMATFARFCAQRTGQAFADHASLHAFSVREPARFWSLFLERSGIPHDGAVEPVITDGDCEHAKFFPNLRVGYVESLLRIDGELDGDRPALTSWSGRGQPVRYSRRELAASVAATAQAFEGLGLGVGDRAVAIVHNDARAVIAGLGALAIGASLSTASPEMGAFSILSRFAALAPTLLICHAESAPQEAAASAALRERLAEIVRGLPSLKAVVVLGDGPLPTGLPIPVHRWTTLVRRRPSNDKPFVWRRFPFDQPLFILFSSGTTGPPKCIVHGAGGTLLEHAKEHRLHCDLRPDDKLFFQTSCAWMMWNWQLSALATGAEIVLFSGAVRGPETLWRFVADERVTVFGTSPPYLQMCADGGLDPHHLPLARLRTVLSTGSVLHDHLYDWVRGHIGPVPLHSISGGSDIIGCFVLGHPDLPVVRGESPCPSLGLDVRSMPVEGGDPASPVGELVCANPFPSRPLGFLGDDRGERFHAAYFATNPGVWTHGDLVEIGERGVRMHGRSDCVLNVHGVRIGPSEIHRILRTIPEVRDCVAVEQPTVGAPGKSRLVLCVVLKPGLALDGVARRKIRHELRTRGSTAHVPELIVAVADLPRTHSGKLSERAVRDVVSGNAVVNVGALRNPASLASIRQALAANERDDARAAAAEPALEGGDGPSLLRLVTASWEHVLDVAPISRDEDFFALGGTSMLALRLCNELHVRTGWDCSPALLAGAPTIDAMCAALDARNRPAGSLVTLRAGRGDPLFVVHGLAGDTLQLRTLARLLPGDRAVVGIQARGLDSRSEALATVEAMAADYVAQLRQRQPAGPYALLGYSFGGLVAFEMARLLLAEGDRVAFLGMLDSGVHDGCLPLREQAEFRLLRKTHRVLSAVRARWPRAILAGRDAMRARIEAQLHANTSRGSPPPYETAPMTPAMQRVIEQVWAAFGAFRPKRGQQAIIYFQASVRPPDYCYPIPIWEAASGSGVTVCRVPGDHFTMIQEPNVGVLARRLGEALAHAAPVT